MIQTVRNAWKVPELKKKMLFTIMALLIFRLGSAIPVPYIDGAALDQYLQSQSGTILGLMNAMSGSAFSMATVFALSIQPYINSSIIIQLLTVAIPALERLAKEGGEEGRKKIASITRYTTVAIALLQGFGYYSLVKSYGLVNGGAAGLMKNNPDMTEEVAQQYIDALKPGALAPWTLALIVIGMLALVVFIVYINNAERRIPVQYAKRVVGRKMYGGQSTHIPMKVSMSGVMPIIFAQSIASLPATVCAFMGITKESEGFGGGLMKVFDTGKPFYSIIYFLLIVGFSYFYSTMAFNPIEVANNLKKNGGFIPGMRPGKPTADFLTKVLSKITMFGALYLSVIAIAPIITGNLVGYQSLAIGGTSVIIVVGVALETVKQMEAQMLMRHYKGFLE